MGDSVTSLTFRHELTLRVRRIGGFVVEQLHQRWPRCAQNVEGKAVASEGVPLGPKR
jgi:hypothetical protein